MNRSKIKKIVVISVISIVIIIGGRFGVYRYNKAQAYNNLITTANKCMDQGDYDKAEGLFEQSLQYKNDSDIQKNIQLAKKLKEVKISYDNAIKLMNDKKYSEAIEAFKKIDKNYGSLYDNAQKNIQECTKQYIAQNIELANTAFKNNKYDEANKEIDEILKVDGNNSEAVNLRNNITTAQKKKQEEESNKSLGKYNINQDQALRLLFSALKNCSEPNNTAETVDNLVQKQYSLYKVLNEHFGSAQIGTFMAHQTDLEDQNIEIYVDPPLDVQKPIYFINDMPLYVFCVWYNPKMTTYVSGDAQIVRTEGLVEAFEQGNLYKILDSSKVKVTEKPRFDGHDNIMNY